MIHAPAPAPPRLGPLRPSTEPELEAAGAELRGRAPTLSWAAVELGLQAVRLEALARAGELLVVPGPWPMRQGGFPGFFVPAWQLVRAEPCPGLATVIAAAAEAGWTGLELDRFMTSPRDDGPPPAELLHAGRAAEVAASIRALGGSRPRTDRREEPERSQ